MQVELGFMVKKIISVALMPLSIGIILAVISLLFLYFNNIKKAKRYTLYSIIWIMLISSSLMGNLMLKPLESSYPKLEKIPDNIEYILLLGGDRKKRAWEALRLYHKIPNIKVITSGFSLHDKVSDANKTLELLVESGIPRENLLMQDMAKTTYEEALAMKKRVGDKPFILVTAAYHMPRTMRLFQKAGLNPIAAPTDFNRAEEHGLFSTLQSIHLQNTEHAWHEYMGLVAYKIQGKI
jgi:uncharacterized SAM-binding protein YcdF (DUF218 family)